MKTSKTTWQDFSTAEYLGNSAIKDTFDRAFKRGQEDYEYLTELVLVVYQEFWQWYNIAKNCSEHPAMNCSDQAAMARSKLYYELWMQADSYACDNLTGEELSYFQSKTADTNGIRGLSFDKLMGYLRLLEDMMKEVES